MLQSRCHRSLKVTKPYNADDTQNITDKIAKVLTHTKCAFSLASFWAGELHCLHLWNSMSMTVAVGASMGVGVVSIWAIARSRLHLVMLSTWWITTSSIVAMRMTFLLLLALP